MPEVSQQPAEVKPPFPKVTVLIVSRNCIQQLRRTLEALKNAQYRDHIEILVVDLGSRDGSGQIDAEMTGVTVLRLPRHFGKARARNIGTRTASGEFLLFLEPTVELPPPAVAAMAKALDADPEIGAVLLEPFDLPDIPNLKRWCVEGGPEPPAILVRKTFVAGMNYFDEKRYSHFGGDLELFRQLRIAGKKVFVMNDLNMSHQAKPAGDDQPSDRALLLAERIQGAAAYVGKHYGFGAGMSFRLGFILSSLGKIRVLMHLLSAQRIDGTQTSGFL